MKRELPTGAIIAIVGGVVAVAAAILIFQWTSGPSASMDDKKIEQMSIQQAKSEYGRYQNPGSGPPQSGEGAAQAAHPEGSGQ